MFRSLAACVTESDEMGFYLSSNKLGHAHPSCNMAYAAIVSKVGNAARINDTYSVHLVLEKTTGENDIF